LIYNPFSFSGKPACRQPGAKSSPKGRGENIIVFELMNRSFVPTILFFIISGYLLPLPISPALAQDNGDASYQGLIRKNLDLRRALTAMEKQYADLENERKILIFHVKELQSAKDLTDRVIQDLKSKVGMLRLEMLKDPTLAKTISSLNQRVRSAEKERDQLREKAGVLTEEKERIVQEINVLKIKYAQTEQDGKRADQDFKKAEEGRRHLSKELKLLKGSLELKEKSLAGSELNVRELTEKNLGLLEQLKDQKENLKVALENQRLEFQGHVGTLDQDFKKAEEDRRRLSKELRRLEESLDHKTKSLARSELNIQEQKKKNLDLLDDLKKLKEDRRGDFENQRLEFQKQMALVKKSLDEAQEEKRRLSGDLKKLEKDFEGAAAELEDKNLELAAREQIYEEKIKEILSDKEMTELHMKELEERAFKAETKLTKTQEALESEVAKATLQASQIVVLKDAKVEMEKKLVRYIDRLMQGKPEEQKIKASSGNKKRGGSNLVLEMPVEEVSSQTNIKKTKLDMHYNLALVYDKRGMYKEEEREYHKCLKINPRDANVHYNLAILYDDKLNKNKKAITHYEKFLELRPIGEEAQNVKTWILRAEQEDRLGVQGR